MGSDTVSTEHPHFTHIESCLDYQGYTYRIDPSITAMRYKVICQRLAKLGEAEEERMGVVYVYAPWGFCVIPRHGFPELRLNFYHETPINEIEDVLADIHTAFEASDIAVNPGDINA